MQVERQTVFQNVFQNAKVQKSIKSNQALRRASYMQLCIITMQQQANVVVTCVKIHFSLTFWLHNKLRMS